MKARWIVLGQGAVANVAVKVEVVDIASNEVGVDDAARRVRPHIAIAVIRRIRQEVTHWISADESRKTGVVVAVAHLVEGGFGVEEIACVERAIHRRGGAVGPVLIVDRGGAMSGVDVSLDHRAGGGIECCGDVEVSVSGVVVGSNIG